MTKAQRLFMARARQRLAALSPEMQSALLATYASIRTTLNVAAIERMIARGSLDALIDAALLDRATIPLQRQVRQTVERAYGLTTRDLPRAGKVDGVLGVSFDHLAPNVTRALRLLESAAVDTLKKDVKETVRAYVENGLRDGRASASVAREIRSIIGLTPNGATAAGNFRAALEAGNVSKALGYKLRDRRSDGPIKRMAEAPLTTGQIDAMTAVYTRRFIANNAATVARQLTVDGYKQGQALSWADAQANGVIPEGFALTKTWTGMDDDRERPEHVVMNGETVPADQPYSNGQMVAGEGDWGCRCLDQITLEREPSAAQQAGAAG